MGPLLARGDDAITQSFNRMKAVKYNSFDCIKLITKVINHIVGAKAYNYILELNRLRRERDRGGEEGGERESGTLSRKFELNLCLFSCACACACVCAYACERACVRALQLNHLYGRIGTTYYNTLKYGQIGTTRIGWTRMWVASLWVSSLIYPSRPYIRVTNLGRFRLLGIRVAHILGELAHLSESLI